MVMDKDFASYEDILEEWRHEIDPEPTTQAKGRAFALKICSQWLDVDPDDDNFHWIDGSGDGGIDVAYFDIRTIHRLTTINRRATLGTSSNVSTVPRPMVITQS